MSALSLALLVALVPGPEGAHRDGAAGADESGGEADEGSWSFVAVPRFTFSSDDGVGLGVRGTAFWHRWGQSPYKTAIHFQAFATSNLVQQHYVKVDAVDAFNVPLRLEAEAALFSTLTANFCGLGDIVDVPACADGARSRHRWWSPSLSTNARWRITPKDALKLELLGGWRGALIVPGSFLEEGPYPGSALAARNPAGDPGFQSQVLVGLVVDTRDFEPAPTRGVFGSLVLRGSDGVTGSSWTYGGATAALAVFAPLQQRPVPLVLAQRVVVDVLVGDPPVIELMRAGGLVDVFAYGGQDLGRGLRSSRFAGPVKAMSQHELRAELGSFDVFGNHVGVGGAVFMDVGVVFPRVDVVGERVAAVAERDGRVAVPSWGAGIALRASWNRAFIMRIDVAASPDDPERLGLYTAPGHPF